MWVTDWNPWCAVCSFVLSKKLLWVPFMFVRKSAGMDSLRTEPKAWSLTLKGVIFKEILELMQIEISQEMKKIFYGHDEKHSKNGRWQCQQSWQASTIHQVENCSLHFSAGRRRPDCTFLLVNVDQTVLFQNLNVNVDRLHFWTFGHRQLT